MRGNDSAQGKREVRVADERVVDRIRRVHELEPLRRRNRQALTAGVPNREEHRQEVLVHRWRNLLALDVEGVLACGRVKEAGELDVVLEVAELEGHSLLDARVVALATAG